MKPFPSLPQSPFIGFTLSQMAAYLLWGIGLWVVRDCWSRFHSAPRIRGRLGAIRCNPLSPALRSGQWLFQLQDPSKFLAAS